MKPGRGGQVASAAIAITFLVACDAGATSITVSERFAELVTSTDGLARVNWTFDRLASVPYDLRIVGDAEALAFPVPFFDTSRAVSISFFETRFDVAAPTVLALDITLTGGFAFVGTPIIGGIGTAEARLTPIVVADGVRVVPGLPLSCRADSGIFGTYFTSCSQRLSGVVRIDETLGVGGLLLVDAKADASGAGFQSANSELTMRLKVTEVPEPSLAILVTAGLWIHGLSRRRIHVPRSRQHRTAA